MQKVDLHTVDLGGELRLRVQPRLDPAHVVPAHPVGGDGLHRGELHAL
jgi:hypothetical protein